MNEGIPSTIERMGYPDRCPYVFGHEPGTLAVVVGSAPCRDRDLEELGAVKADVIAVNHSGIVLPLVDHWVSIHGGMMPQWLEDRREIGLPDPKIAAGGFADNFHDHRFIWWRIRPYTGSSSLLAVQWALFWGYRRIVLCGVPLTGDQSLLSDGSSRTDRAGYECYRKKWKAKREHLPLDECVRSMSGWTRDTFGCPDEEFLRS